MNSAQMSDLALAAIEAAIRAADFTTVKMGLFTGAPALGPGTLLATLAALEPTFTGYSRQAIAIGAVRRNANNDYIDPFPPATFQPSALTALPQTVTGYFITVTIAPGPEELWASEFLPAPGYTFTDTLSAISITYDFYIKNLTTWGGECAQC